MKVLTNPYLQEFQEVGTDPLKLWQARERLVKMYSWAIPDEGAINLIKKYSPLVEMGAGGGYWASLIQQLSGDIICYDKFIENNRYSEKLWTSVQLGQPTDLINHSERTLFLCWPPYDETMAQNCLKYFEGQHIIYIGELEGGCTANDGFFKKLDNQFTLVETYNHPQWWGVHDSLFVYKRN